MARNYENSPADEREDARGMKATGLSKEAYEKSPRDKAEDAAGAAHVRKPRKPKAPPAPPFGLAQAPGETNEPAAEPEPDADDEGI